MPSKSNPDQNVAADSAANEQQPAGKGAPKAHAPKVLSTKKRGTETTSVITDGIRTWKETK